MTPMLLATIWRSLRWRLLAALMLVALPAFLVAWSYGPERKDAIHFASYSRYVEATWFQLPGPSALFLLIAVIVSASGRLMRPGTELAYTLALPISRRRWLLAHAGSFVAAVAAVQLFVLIVFAIGARHWSQPLELSPLLVRSVGVIAAASVWVAVTIGALGLARYSVLAIALVLGALELEPHGRFQLQLPVTHSMGMLSAWDPWAFADPRAWQGGAVPVASIGVALALGLVGLGVGAWRMQRLEA
ncbi:MAG TPA: hypothetical protein VGP25_03740 [Gemmatimonadaceae bacterium]|nr:hypothetical protein [Gemmatimonadaceae bacterium]